MKIKFDRHRHQWPDREGGIKVPYAPVKRAYPRWRWYFVVVLILSPFIYFTSSVVYDRIIVDAPGIVDMPRLEVRAVESGYVKKINVRRGDYVNANQVMVQVHQPDLEEKRRIFEVEIRLLTTQLNEPDTRVPAKLLPVLMDNVNAALKVYQARHGRVEILEELLAEGAATTAELETARVQMLNAELALNEARSVLMRSENVRETAKRKAELRAKIGRTQVQLEAVKEEISRLKHRFDKPGQVIEVNVEEGEYVERGSTLLVLTDASNPFITVYLDPKFQQYTNMGQCATVRFPDGRKVMAEVVEEASLTKRLPPSLADAFGQRPLSLVTTLRTEELFEDRYSMHGLPVEVRFHQDMNWQESTNWLSFDALFAGQ